MDLESGQALSRFTWLRRLREFEQVPCLHLERLRDQFEIPQAYLNLSGLHLSEVTPVQPHPFSHLKLCPAAGLP